jgi:hypothetical protein
MVTTDDLARWHQLLRAILDAVADASRALGGARASGGLSGSVGRAMHSRAEELLDQICALVDEANLLAGRIALADASLADIVHPLLGVPGERPEIDLRPWWSKLLLLLSSTAHRTSAGESLETLRLEADAALIRATGALAARS